MSHTPMKLALDALQLELQNYDGPVPHIDCAITALREALAQPQQEPVARIDSPVTPLDWGLFRAEITLTTRLPQFSDLYTSPPARKPLTDAEPELNEGDELAHMHQKGWVAVRRYARAIEAAHGIKETK